MNKRSPGFSSLFVLAALLLLGLVSSARAMPAKDERAARPAGAITDFSAAIQSKIPAEMAEVETLNRLVHSAPPEEAAQALKAYLARNAISLERTLPGQVEDGGEVRLKKRVLSPGVGLEIGLQQEMTDLALQAPRHKFPAVVYFTRPLSLGDWIEMLELGIDPAVFLSGRSALVIATPVQLGALAGRDYFQWAGQYLPQDKYADADLRQAQAAPQSGLRVMVIPFKAYPDEQLPALQASGASALAYDQTTRLYYATLPAAKFEAVAGLAWVEWLEIVPEKVLLGTPKGFEPDDSRELINAPQAWAIGNIAAGVRVGVIDTGIWGSPDFPSGSILHSNSIANNHGTHVSGILASRGSRDIEGQYDGRGVAYGALLWGEDFHQDTGTIYTILRNQNVLLANNSWGFWFNYTYTAAAQTVDAFIDDGLTLVFGAGNTGPSASTVTTPATAKNTITVGAISYTVAGDASGVGKIVDYSSRGPTQDDGRLKPELVAPGGDGQTGEVCQYFYGVVSNNAQKSGDWLDTPACRWPSDEYYTRMSGTSMSAPFVTGVAALFLKQYSTASLPDGVRPRDIKAHMIANAIPIKYYGSQPQNGYANNTVGYGLVDAFDTVYDTAGEKETLLWGQGGVSRIGMSYQDWNIVVPDSAEKLIVVMAYEDYRGDLNTNPELWDNLSVKVTAPDHTEFTFTTPTGVTSGSPEEKIVIANPTSYGSGTWKLTVWGQGFHDNFSSQRYSIVALVHKVYPHLSVDVPDYIVLPGQSFDVTPQITNTGGLTAAGVTSWITAPAGFGGEKYITKFVGNLTGAGSLKSVTFTLIAPDECGNYYVSDGVGGINHNLNSAGHDFLIQISCPPTAFNKVGPPNAASGVSLNPTLSWGSSTSGVTYEYCIDTSLNSACDSAWISTGTSPIASIGSLSTSTTYSWQARAVNLAGTAYANGGAWWSFTTQALPPGAFSKTSPPHTASGLSITQNLQWETSSYADSYQYCYDTIKNNSCDSSWKSTGAGTSITLGRLSFATTYYWQVRAINPTSSTYANDGGWWSFTTVVVPPAAFNKTSPAHESSGISTSPTLHWGASSGATSYEYCLDTTKNNLCDTAWISTGASTSAALGGLNAGTSYSWQVRAVNAGASTEANSGTWWRFTTQAAPPGAFNKTSPSNGAGAVSTSPTLSWSASSGAASYEYCFDTTNDSVCASTWVNVGSATSAALNGLGAGSAYFWQVRASNTAGSTLANSGAWWSFTTLAAPGAYGKAGPGSGAAGVSTSPALSWGASSGASGYEYCIDASANNTCDASWTSAGGSTSVNLGGLSAGSLYSWQVRASNDAGSTLADSGAWWSFTTLALPGAFSKSSPASGSSGVSTSPTLSWSTSSGAASYEYCYDTSNDSACDGAWTGSGANTNANLSGLNAGITYHWQVRAANDAGQRDADGGLWWSFTTQAAPPAEFGKISPVNGTNGTSTSPTLSWTTRSGATRYEYCYDPINNNTCDTTWTDNALYTSAIIGPLTFGSTYYWQVRAIVAGSPVEADGGAWWSFTVQVSPPPNFGKISPADAESGVSTSPTLYWADMGGVNFEYCLDTTASSTCASTWVATSGNHGYPGGLSAGITYFWQVRGSSGGGTVYADGGAWWSFITLPLPGAFGKTGPVNWESNVSISPTLSWGASSDASSYEYCIDTSFPCAGAWTSTGDTSVAVGPLEYGTTYSWQVRAVNSVGSRDADGGTWWIFLTQAPPPGVFGKFEPQHNAAGVSLIPILSWNASSTVGSYEYCIDTSDDGACDGNWVDAGGLGGTPNTSVSIGPLGYATAYFWQVRASNGSGAAYADNSQWWTFTTRDAPPAGFGKTSPADSAAGVSTNPTLGWAASNGATSFEYCLDTSDNGSCDGEWTSSGADANNPNTSVDLSSLPAGTTFHWQVRARNAGGVLYADGEAWWSFTTLPIPGEFNKSSPLDEAGGTPIHPALGWNTSSGATSYEYCYDTTQNSTCDGSWVNVGNNTSAAIGPLDHATLYFWHVRASNASGIREADGGGWWSFTTQVAAPATFAKIGPPDGASEIATSLVLSWESNSQAAGYKVCFDTSDDSTCAIPWMDAVGTSANLSGLNPGIAYYWQVQAVNPGGVTEANAGHWWSFTTLPAPGAFAKSGPADGATLLLTNTPGLNWSASSAAADYEYCYDTIDNSACDGAWIAGDSSGVTTDPLNYYTLYYWQVRAANSSGIMEADGGAWWRFSTRQYRLVFLPVVNR